ncbi:hypothetical protein D9M68_148400 [compost metagenome]
MTSKNKASTPWSIGSRVLAALVGGYALAYAFTAFFTVYLPLARADRVVFASLACFAVWTAAAIYVFAARSATRAWLVLGGLTLAMGLAAYLSSDLGVRP